MALILVRALGVCLPHENRISLTTYLFSLSESAKPLTQQILNVASNDPPPLPVVRICLPAGDAMRQHQTAHKPTLLGLYLHLRLQRCTKTVSLTNNQPALLATRGRACRAAKTKNAVLPKIKLELT